MSVLLFCNLIRYQGLYIVSVHEDRVCAEGISSICRALSLVLELSVHIYSKADVQVYALGRILRSHLGAFENPCDLAAWGPMTFEPVRWWDPGITAF